MLKLFEVVESSLYGPMETSPSQVARPSPPEDVVLGGVEGDGGRRRAHCEDERTASVWLNAGIQMHRNGGLEINNPFD